MKICLTRINRMVQYENEHGGHRNSAICAFAKRIWKNAIAEKMHQSTIHLRRKHTQQ